MGTYLLCYIIQLGIFCFNAQKITESHYFQVVIVQVSIC